MATAPLFRLSVSAIALPEPRLLLQEPPPSTEQLQATPVIAAGTVSVKAAPVTLEGPLFVTVTV